MSEDHLSAVRLVDRQAVVLQKHLEVCISTFATASAIAETDPSAARVCSAFPSIASSCPNLKISPCLCIHPLQPTMPHHLIEILAAMPPSCTNAQAYTSPINCWCTQRPAAVAEAISYCSAGSSTGSSSSAAEYSRHQSSRKPHSSPHDFPGGCHPDDPQQDLYRVPGRYLLHCQHHGQLTILLDCPSLTVDLQCYLIPRSHKHLHINKSFLGAEPGGSRSDASLPDAWPASVCASRWPPAPAGQQWRGGAGCCQHLLTSLPDRGSARSFETGRRHWSLPLQPGSKWLVSRGPLKACIYRDCSLRFWTEKPVSQPVHWSSRSGGIFV